MKRRLACLAVLTFWAWMPAGARADVLLEDALGDWLDQVAPALAETLARHPRFQGETLRLVALTPGGPGGPNNRLTEAVERRLRQRLLAVEGVRLAAEQPRQGCAPPRQVGYLVRAEVTSAGDRQGRLHLAVVDLAEAVWVSGISHEWQGRLTAAERDALRSPVVQANPGTAESPIPVTDAGAVAAALKAHLRCTLPRGLDGTLFVSVPEAAALSRVALALQSALSYEALAAVTTQRADASWLLALDAGDATADVRALHLTLTGADGAHPQRLASVFVVGHAGAPQPQPAPPSTAAVATEPAGSRGADLLSALEMRPAAPEGICDDRRARINSCVEITFDLHERAYLFVVSTRDHAVVEAPCAGAVERVDAGRRRYRLRVPPGGYAVNPADTGPDAGFYVLAVRERSVARQLDGALSAAPGACRQDDRPPVQSWLAELRRVLDRHPGQVSWRALHVAHDSAGIVAL